MKGFVFSLALPHSGRRSPDIRGFLRRYGLYVWFAAMLLAGLVLGVVYARNADEDTLRSLDLLFTTNLDARLSQSAFGTFSACFASDFLFLLCACLFGAAAWGIPFLSALVCFKGFCVALVRFSGSAFGFSAQLFRRFIGREQPSVAPRRELMQIASRFVSALCLTFIASVLDTLLWTLFAGTFRF